MPYVVDVFDAADAKECNKFQGIRRERSGNRIEPHKFGCG